MRETNGETTNVNPGLRTAGSWYVNDFPPPMQTIHFQFSILFIFINIKCDNASVNQLNLIYGYSG